MGTHSFDTKLTASTFISVTFCSMNVDSTNVASKLIYPMMNIMTYTIGGTSTLIKFAEFQTPNAVCSRYSIDYSYKVVTIDPTTNKINSES